MKPRMNHFAAAPQEMKAMLAFETAIRESGLPKSLIELVKIRASQINGCAFCIHMHTRDARAAGETEDRINLLPAWRESPLYTPQERAALAWTESLTLVSQRGAPDEEYEALVAAFSEADAVRLTLLIGAINVWNRLSIGFRAIHPVDGEPAPARSR